MKEVKEQGLWGCLGEESASHKKQPERESTTGLFKKHKEANVLGTFNLSEMGSFEQIGT